MACDLSWEYVSLSDANAVRGLLKFRSEFDPTFDIDNRGILESAMDLAYVDENIHLTYIDLQQVMDSTTLTEHQRDVIELYQQGYDLNEICEIMKVSDVEIISGVIDNACASISARNKERWVEDFAKWNFIRVQSSYKECSRCKKFLPMTDEYYTRDKRNLDGFHSFCKKCRRTS